MKTTIEINGYEIVISQSEETLTVTAMKEGETVEEFELGMSDSEDGSQDEIQGGEEVQDFGEFEGEDDNEESEESQGDDDMEDMGDDDMEEMGEEMGEEDEVKLESFQSFINKRKK